ncbi:MAG: CBS domain-containing protein [Ilumatobacter sp.]|jgi:CBS domain-containing membrane protein
MKSTPITKVMTTDLTTIQGGQRISAAYEIFKHATIHHLPVLDGESQVGVLSSTDILRLAYDVDGTDDRSLESLLDHRFTIDNAMTPDPSSLPDTATVKEAAEILSDGSIHSVIVLERRGGAAEIVTTTELARFLLEQFR